jgi:diguanylate cyclase (GGDEF)-like protein
MSLTQAAKSARFRIPWYVIRSLKLKLAIGLAAGFLGLEAAGLEIFRNNLTMGWSITFFSLLIDAGLMFAISCWRAWRSISLQRHWILLATGLWLNFAALAIRAYIYLVVLLSHRQVSEQIDYTDLLMVFAYIPLVILLSLPSGKTYPTPLLWVDAIQVIIAGYLIYIKLFSIIPFTQISVQPISGERLIAFYNIADLTLCCMGALRFHASTTKDEKNFYRAYCWFIGVSTILIGLHNALAGQTDRAGYSELLGIAPGLFFCILVFFLPAESRGKQATYSRNKLTIFLNTASPLFYTLSLLVLSIDAARNYFRFGMSTIAAAFLLYGFRSTVLQRNYEHAEHSLETVRDNLQGILLTDQLTGIANRRCFDQTLESEWNRAVHGKDPMSLLLIDVDYFKRLNDRFGHSVGDECLVRVAAALHSALPRAGDLLARYGGEEFAAILPYTDQSGARLVAARMQDAVNKLKIQNESSIGPYVSISIGIATHGPHSGGSPAILLEASDRALYQAKTNGRNRIEVAAMPTFPSAS